MLPLLEYPPSVEFEVELAGVRVLSEMPGDKLFMSTDEEPSKAGSKEIKEVARLLPEQTQSAEQKRFSAKS